MSKINPNKCKLFQIEQFLRRPIDNIKITNLDIFPSAPSKYIRIHTMVQK